MQAQHFDISSNKKRVSIPFRYVRNMVIIQMNINERGPFNFVLDTGVGLMIITDPALVDSLNITNKHTVKIPGLGEGEDAEAYVTNPLDIDIPGLKSYHVAAAILKKDHFHLSNFIGMPVHGLLGYEFFNRLAVQINFPDSSITVTRPYDIKVLAKGIKVPMTIEEKKPYIHAKVTLPDGSVSVAKLIVDLGAGHPVSLDNIIQKKGLPQKFIIANLGIGLNGPISGFISRINEIDIGGYKIKQPLASFPDDKRNIIPSVSRDGNLGLQILKRFKIVFDYSGNALYLKKASGFNAPFEHDMSGLEYYTTGENRKHIIISRVEPGSPGYEIGIEKDDEIVAINFKPVWQMSLEQIDNLFRSKEGRNLLLEIYHDKKYDKVVLTLNRRI
ncbi:MAG: peptide-binding protein [Sphingobacteriaceae bacterium]|nr:MAG: peptide-binding protein [Sphingobacteriaceae bacterium]